jgi:hypothetical protein
MIAGHVGLSLVTGAAGWPGSRRSGPGTTADKQNRVIMSPGGSSGEPQRSATEGVTSRFIMPNI